VSVLNTLESDQVRWDRCSPIICSNDIYNFSTKS